MGVGTFKLLLLLKARFTELVIGMLACDLSLHNDCDPFPCKNWHSMVVYHFVGDESIDKQLSSDFSAHECSRQVNENTELQSTIAALRQQIAEKVENLSQQSFMDAQSESSCKSNTAWHVNEDAALNTSVSGEVGHVTGAEREAVEINFQGKVKVPDETPNLQPQILQQVF